MKRTILILTFLTSIVSLLPAQNSGPLSSLELDREPTFYSMAEAMKAPEKVYKLSLIGQGLKEIPAEVFQMTNLQVLNLGENKLSSISGDISKLKNLQFLSLFSNKLRYLPNELNSLSNLEVLYVGRNRLVDIPAWVGGLGKLRRLDVAYNRITPSDVARLMYLLPKCDITY